MASKTFKIGERAYFGIWKAEVLKNLVILTGIDYTTKKVETTKSFIIPISSDRKDDLVNSIESYLNDQMDYYNAEKIRDWIESKLFKGFSGDID